MFRARLSPILTVLAFTWLLGIVTAQSTCNATTSCPESAPCCSEYGFCGTGTYCLGVCEPLYSFKPTSCTPNPICQDTQSTFYNLERVQQNASLYDGNATAYDWIVNSGTVMATDIGTRLTLKESDSGTKLSSTRYIQYGKIDFVIQTSKWPGVVTAAITMSDVKDEIDWEFTGHSVNEAQTNYWYLGIANYSATEGQSFHVDTDTSSNFHTYTLDWQEDYMNWIIDGNIVRTVQKTDTYTSDGVAHYPMTPSRIQLSIWPAGVSSSAQGTIDWAGGMIDWSDPDYVSNGYFWNTVQSVKVTCAKDPDQQVDTTGWVYTGNGSDGLPQVLDTNASTIIGAATRGVVLDSSLLTHSAVLAASLMILGVSMF